MSVFLSDLSLEETCLIDGFLNSLPFKTKLRLLELGFYSGVKIKVLNKSLLNNVVLLEINNYIISIRKEIAKCIIVKRI